jgi:GNAT superfamily N-acetyltransferase
MSEVIIQPITEQDRAWVRQFVIVHWGANIIIVHGVTYKVDEQPGFIARQNGELAGLITYHMQGRECEIVSLDSLHEGQGIGTKLIEAVKQIALQAGCTRLWLITTNDNLHALRFYQKRGFMPVAVHRNAVEQARKLKPEIPMYGNDGILIRDEIELEMLLNQDKI